MRWVVLVLVVSGCSGAAASAGTAAIGAGAVRAGSSVPLSVHWSRTAAEHRAVFLQTYGYAGERVRELASGRATGSWAVVLDADETVIDNSLYQLERGREGLGFTEETWDAWVRREVAEALPGAAEFIVLVRSLGGRVAIVTNRTQAQCPATQSNFMKVGILVDVMLCRPPESSDKNPRFAQLREGGASPGVPPLEIVLWVGDNIQDFPALTQSVRDAPLSTLADFGARFIVLPNPMYGSWERNAVR